MKTIVNPLKPGDVIQTHPSRGFWGCAVVLSARDSTDRFHPMCHIGTTTLITKRKFSWKSINPDELGLVRLSPVIRVAPHEYYRDPEERICIGIYALKSASGLTLLGSVDPRSLYQDPLTFDVGDGTNGRFPLCGPIPDDLGHEAVVAWRQVHDAQRFELEARRDMEAFEGIEETRLAEARQARQSRAAPNNSFKPKPLRGSA